MEGILFELPAHVGYAFLALVVLMLMNTVAGVVKASIKENETEFFDWSYFPDFIERDFKRHILPLIIPAAAGWAFGGEFYAIFYAIAAPVAASFLARFFDKVAVIYELKFGEKDYE